MPAGHPLPPVAVSVAFDQMVLAAQLRALTELGRLVARLSHHHIDAHLDQRDHFVK